MTPAPASPFRHAAWLLPVLAACWLCLWHRLGDASLRTSDEAAHTDVARNVLSRGRWTDLWYMDDPYAGKPPLKIWATAALLRALGQEEWVVRLPDAACATLTTLLVWLIARRQWRGPAVVAAPLLFVLAPYPLAVHGWREGVQDSALTLLMTAAAYGYLRAGSSPAGVRWRWLLVMGIALGAGSLVKSVVAYLVLLPIVLHLAWERRLAALRERAWMLSLVVAAAPWLAWHGAFLEGELGYNIGRRIAGWHTEPHPPSAYVTWLSGGFRPFGIALPAAMALCAARGLGGSSFDRWLSVWGAGLVLPWLLAHLKHPWYVYPAYPALALGLARLLFPPEAWDGARRWRGATIVRAAGLVLFVAGARVAVLEAWRLVERPERVPLHDAIDWVKCLPAPERVIGVLLDPATVCADERYYLDLAGGSVAYLRDPGELLSMAATEPRLIAVLPGDALPGFVVGLSRLPERSLRVAWSGPRCRRVRGHGRLPTRALVALGTFLVPPPFPGLPPVTFGEGFGQPESSSRGEFAWAAERASLWFPLAGCGTFHARLHALRPDTLVRLALPGATGVVHAGPEGVDVSWDVEVPPGGAMGTVEVPLGCVSPRDLDPSEDDTRCLGVSVANPRVTR